jgi:hypothetical protein
LILQTIRDMYSQNVERDMYCHFNSQISLMFMSYVKKYTHGEHSEGWRINFMYECYISAYSISMTLALQQI